MKGRLFPPPPFKLLRFQRPGILTKDSQYQYRQSNLWVKPVSTLRGEIFFPYKIYRFITKKNSRLRCNELSWVRNICHFVIYQPNPQSKWGGALAFSYPLC